MWPWLASLLSLALVCGLGFGQDLSQQVCKTGVSQPGKPNSVSVRVLVPRRDAGENGYGCGDIAMDMVQAVTAASFTSVTFRSANWDIEVWDACQSPSSALRLMSKFVPSSQASSLYCSDSPVQAYLGTVGPLTNEEATHLANLAASLDTILISPRAESPSLSDKDKYPLFFRTSPPSTSLARAMVAVLEKMGWEAFVIVYVDSSYGSEVYEAVLQDAYRSGLCVSQVVRMEEGSTTADYTTALAGLGTDTAVVFLGSNKDARQALLAQNAGSLQWVLSELDRTMSLPTATPAVSALSLEVKVEPSQAGFPDHFIGLEANPTLQSAYFQKYYETKYSCSLQPGAANACPPKGEAEIRQNFVESPWVNPTINAILALTETFRAICPQEDVCPALLQMSPRDFAEQMKLAVKNSAAIKMEFDANGNPVKADYSVIQHLFKVPSSNVVATFESGVLSNLPSLTGFKAATCASLGCGSCFRPETSVAFRYTPGDLVVASLVSAHQPTKEAFACGAGVAERLSALVAAEWAASEFKGRNPALLQGVTLGSLVADVCPDSFVAESFLSDLLSGSQRLEDSRGQVVSASTVKAFVDQTGMEQAMKTQEILSELELPQVQTGSTSSSLKGAYLNHVLPTDTDFYTAIASFLQKEGLNYVEVAMDDHHNHHTSLFRNIAAKYDVCITGTVDLSQGSMANAVTSLTSGVGKVAVVIADNKHLAALLTQIQASGVSDLLVIAGSQAWTLDLSLLPAQRAAANNLITFAPELPDNIDFITWLAGLTSTSPELSSNPFLRELFEVTNDCSVVSATRGQYSRTCDANDRFNYYQGKTPYVIESVNMVARQLHQVITEVCGSSNGGGLCPEFHAASDIGERLQRGLQQAIGDGDGLTGLKVYVYKSGRNYVQIGTYDSGSARLSALDANEMPDLSTSQAAVCPNQCQVCQYLYSMRNKFYLPGDWLLAGSFSVSQSGPENLQPYICGEIRTQNGPQYTTAMMYAIQQVNNGRGPSAKGITIGGLAMDHCNNDRRANLLVSDVFSGLYANEGVDPTHVLSWMTDNTGSTHDAAELLDPLGVAMVSPSATSARLMDYPTFFRTVQGDPTSISAIMKIVKDLGFGYIQVVYTDTDFGRESLETSRTVAKAEGICITNVQMVVTGQETDTVASLKASETKVVVLLTNTRDTTNLIRSITEDSQASQTLLLLLLSPYSSVIEQYGPKLSHPVMSLRLRTQTLTGYRDYLDSSPVENPYFAKYYMKAYDCNLPGYSMYGADCPTPLAPITASADYTDENYVLATINSVYASVDALDRTLKEFCGNEYRQPCEAFLKDPNWRERYNELLNSVNFIDEGNNNFRFLEREGNVVYDILQSTTVGGKGTYQEVGSYAGAALFLESETSNQYVTVQSGCADPCLGCAFDGVEFSHTPGDIYLAGLFDVHQRSTSPFTCGDINPLHGYLLNEAFHLALKQVNEKKGIFADILQGTRLGGVGLDQCGSRIKAGNLVSNINNGMVSLARDGLVIEPGTIDAYIGSYDSLSSLYVARILTDLEIPQISYASTSSQLEDQRVYPYFFRTVPSDKNIVAAMLTFLDKNNIRYVQVLYEDTDNAYSSRDLFVKMAAERSICVAQTVVYERTGQASNELSNQVVSELLDTPAANTVVTFLGTSFINSVLQAVARSQRAQGKLRFFGDLSWADHQDAIVQVEPQAVGSFTMKMDDDDVDIFESYIDSKTLANSQETPWFEEYYQHIHECYTNKAKPGPYDRECALTLQSTINSVNYQQDPGVVYVMNAVYAAAFAIHKTLVEKCGVGYTTVCQAYKTSATRREDVRDNLDSVDFVDPVGNQFKFDDHREAPSNFRYYLITEGRFGGANYEEVGLYNHSNAEVSLEADFEPPTNSDCDREDACRECPAIRDTTLRYFIYNSSANSQPPTNGQRPIPKDPTTVVAFFDLHEQGVDPYRCGKLNMAGFHHFLAFLYSAQSVVNSNIDGITDDRGLRLIAIDTCSNSLRVDQDLFGLLQGSGLCNTHFDMKGAVLTIGNLGSVLTVGEANTRAASRMLEGPAITYVSPHAPGTDFDHLPHLVRAGSPLSAQLMVLSGLLAGCHTMDVLYEDSRWGLQGYRGLADSAYRHSIPLGSTDSLAADALEGDVDVAVSSLSPYSSGQVVVLIGGRQFLQQVFASARALARADDYVWMVVTDWDFSDQDVAALAGQNEITLMRVEPVTDSVSRFDTFVHNLQYVPNSETRNNAEMPREWFEEFYQVAHDCSLASALKPINLDKLPCDVNLQVAEDSVNQDPLTLNTIASMYAMTYGLNKYVGACAGSCNTGQPLNNPTARAKILSDILSTDWDISSDLDLSVKDLNLDFDQMHRWWDRKYNLVSYQTPPSGATHSAVYTGKGTEPERQAQCALRVVDLNATAAGQAGGKAPADKKDPRNYYEYDSDGDKEFDWPIWAIATAVLTSLGILLTVVMFLILLCAYPYRGGTSALGYLAIVGIILVYAINFAFFVHASDEACGIRRFFMGVVYCVVFASLLVKAVDNWRFAHVDYAEARYEGLSSPCAMVLYALVLVLVECIVPIMWLILRHPTASEKYPEEMRHDHYWCDDRDDYDLGLVLSMSYVAFVILVTAIFSALAYDSGRNNYESRWILFGCVATGGCFMVWMIVSTNADAPYRDPSVAIANLVNAAILMVVLPLRKTVLLIRAKRDAKEKPEFDDTDNGGPYSNGYDNSYPNPAFTLDDYEPSPYMEG